MSTPILIANASYTENPSTIKFDIHTHDTYEIFCYLSGNAKYFVEGNTYPLKPGDILIMKKAEAHSLLIHSTLPYGRIVIHFNSDAIAESIRPKIVDFLDNRPLGTKNRFSASLFKGTNWIYYLRKVCEIKNKGEASVYLSVLLSELCSHFDEIKEQAPVSGEIVDIVNIVKYINENLTNDLTLDIICDHFFISKSHINRKFKKIIGTTVWEYIITKRLLLAKELLKNHVLPTEVYLECGFKDYSTFFRAYKSKFGVSPKNDSYQGDFVKKD